jgi:phage shock protein PspC (stress-responsive transcriptional regulator)
VRVGYVILSILSAAFPGILIYLLLWLLMPDADE